MIWRCLLVACSGAVLVGCHTGGFRTRRLGQVDPAEAYQAALEVVSDYYTVASADRRSGRITCEPKPVSSTTGRLLSTTAGREHAVVRIRRDGPVVWADVRVTIERRESAGYDSLTALSAHGDVPNQTPAQGDAPFTREQNQLWRVTGSNLDVERRILADIYSRVGGK